MILDSPPASVVLRDSARATRDDPVRSNSPVVKAETSATPVMANIPHVPALSALLAERGAPASLTLKSQMRYYIKKLSECDEVIEYLRIDISRPSICVRCAENIARFGAYPNLCHFRDGSSKCDNCVATRGTYFQFPVPKVAVLRRLAPWDPFTRSFWFGVGGGFSHVTLISGCFGDTFVCFWNSSICE
jgi:hypothetical protein